MAIKTLNLNSKTKVDIKQQAEEILDKLGIPHPVAIDMYYRQIVSHNGIPFPVTLSCVPLSRDDMTDNQFDQMMTIGLNQAKENNSFDVDQVFEHLEEC